MHRKLGRGQRTSRNSIACARRAVSAAMFEPLEGREMFSTFSVVNTLDSGAGSLRQALLDANNHPNSGGADVIAFNIPGNGSHVISPTLTLPGIFEAAIIDGFTQPGSKANTVANGNASVQTITIDGAAAPFGTDGIDVYAGGSTVRGLAITNFKTAADGSSGDGIRAVAANYGGKATLEGNAIFGNQGDGIEVSLDAIDTVIGGPGAAVRNVIYGNVGNGIELKSDGAVVQNNLIGIALDGISAFGNGADGIRLLDASDAMIGGPIGGDGNVIAFNGARGVHVELGNVDQIRSNSIYANVGLGIDLANDGPDTNDVDDLDLIPPNHGQNYPSLDTATFANGQTTIHGSLNSHPNTLYHIQLFLSDVVDSSGHGEGKTIISNLDVTTDSFGNAGLGTISSIAKAGYISAIATDASTGDSSEFSVSLKIAQPSAGGFVSGKVYRDTNGNNTSDAGEPPLSGVTVYSDENANGLFDPGEASSVSDMLGNYTVNEPNNGTFKVRVVPASEIMTENANGFQVTLNNGSGSYVSVNFGLFHGGTISGATFVDANGNGAKDVGEAALPNVKVTLDTDADGIIDLTTTTDANGLYQFGHLGPAVYRVRAVAPAATAQTSINPSDVNDNQSGLNVTGANFGFKPQVVADVPVFLSDMTPTYACNGWGAYERDKSNGESGAHDGKAITLDGATFNKGLGVHAGSELKYALNGQYKRFVSKVGVDDEVGNSGSVIFQVFADGVKLFDSGKMTGSSATKNVDVDVTGRGELRLVVTDAGDGNNCDHADWADANVIKSGNVVPPPPGAFLSDLTNAPGAVNGWGAFERDKSNGESGAHDGKTLTINGKTYAKGLGVHAASSITYDVTAGATHFLSDYGIDDEVGNAGSVIFKVYNAANNQLLFSSAKITGSDAAKTADVSLAGVTTIRLVVDGTNDGINNDHADWGNARFA